ncbi:MAG: TlpA disulfide reductase family protein [Methylococcales bacterium]|nr:TlpA disulfide reductase family protein [Methylococcales bacterium]
MNVIKVLLVALFIALVGFLFRLNNHVENVDFSTLKGEKLSLEKLRGKPVLVTFWATDCDNCLKEIPLFIDLHERYHAQGLDILGVSMYYEQPNLVVEFNKVRPLPYLLTLDIEAKFSKTFGNVTVTPTTFLLDAKGEIVWQKVGLIDETELTTQIEKSLKEK